MRWSFEQQPTQFISPRYGSPIWAPDENSFIYVENQRNNNDETIRNTLVQVDVLNNFQSLEIDVTTDPLSLTQGQIIPVNYPEFSVPESDSGTVSYLSPSGRYLSMISYTGFVEANIHVYDLQSNTLVFEQQPTTITYPAYYPPWWSPDETYFAYIEKQRDENSQFLRDTIVQVDILNNVQIDGTLDNILIANVGNTSCYLGLGNWSPDNQHFAFRLYDENGTVYNVMYTPSTQQLRAFCDP